MVYKKIISILLIISIILSLFSLSACKSNDVNTVKYKVDNDNLLYDINTASYSYYFNNLKKIDFASNDVVLSCENVVNAASYEYETVIDNEKYIFIDSNSEWIEWTVTAEEELKYVLSIDYKTQSGDNSDMILSLQLDNQYPYEELKNLSLSRLFEDSCGDKFETDTTGNDIKPSKNEVITNLTSGFVDTKGYFSDCYQLSIPEGEHTIRLSSVKGAILVKNLILGSQTEIESYKDYYFGVKDKNSSSKSITIEAEHPKYTTDASIYPII